MTKARRRQKRPSHNHQLHRREDHELPFIEHVHELRKRLTHIAISVGFFGAATYAVERQIVAILLKPAHGQQFIYTSPGGGIDFLFRVCVYVGIIASIPVIIHQLLRYIEPLIKKESAHFIAWGAFVSGVLAVAGVLYGYFWGLPAALNFLLHQFVTTQIRPLVTIQSYMSFVMVYMVGSALLFQVPLVLLFINRIKPLKPQRLFRYERHVIAGALVISALMNPTPNILALLFLAGPIILMYQIGIVLIWYLNRSHQPSRKVLTLREQDAAEQTARSERATHLQAWPEASFVQTPVTAPHKPQLTPAAPVIAPKSAPMQIRPQQYVHTATQRRATFTPRVRPVMNDFHVVPRKRPLQSGGMPGQLDSAL